MTPYHNTTSSSILDVLIMGAGQAGMAAAHRLLQTTTTNNIHVIEAHGHVGGRTRNWDVVTGDTDVATPHCVELGGTWLSPNHTAFLDLCHELGIGVYKASFIPQKDDHKDNTAARKPSSTQEEEDGEDDDEWPWWYWGPDYSLSERQTMKHVILHTSYSSTNTVGGEKIKFHTPRQLLEQLNPHLVQQMQQIGTLIDTALAKLPDLNWSTFEPGHGWSDIDAYTTAAYLTPSEIIAHNTSTVDARNIVRNVIHNKNAQEPSRVGYLYNLLSFKGCNSLGPDSEYRVHGGTQAVPLAIAKRLGRHRITLDDPIVSIQPLQQSLLQEPPSTHHKTNLHWQVTTQSGKRFVTKAIVMTGSPPVVTRVLESTRSSSSLCTEPSNQMQQQQQHAKSHRQHYNLPANQAQLLTSMPMGTSRKVIAVYHKGPWWRSFGLTGDVLAASLPPTLSVPVDGNSWNSNDNRERQPIFSQCFDTSPFSQQYGVLTCFVEGRANIHFSEFSRAHQDDLLCQFLELSFADYIMNHQDNKNTTAFPNDIWKPDLIHHYNWADDPYVRGAYTAFFGPGILSMPEMWHAYRQMEKLPNIFLAGSDYHVGFGNGYMEGAVRSGQQAADQVRERLKSSFLVA